MAYVLPPSPPNLARQTSRRVSFSPNVTQTKPGKSYQFARKCRSQSTTKEGSPVVELFHCIGGKVARAFRLVSARKVSPKYCSPYVSPVDAHRTQAVEECIEFLNARRSFQRSYSVSECSYY